MPAKRFKQCFLHIGGGKTGTSSIQSELYRRRFELQDLGYFYPNNDANHIFLATRFREDPTEIAFHAKNGRSTRAMIDAYTEREMAMLETDLDAFAGHTLVFSSEYFPPSSPEGCHEIARYLQGLCERVTVVCYIRHPLSHAVSAAQQAVKMGFKTLQHAETDPHFFQPSKILPKFENAFGRENMCVRAYERTALKDGDVVADFMEIIGLKKDVASPTKGGSNSSLCMETAQIADAVTRQFPRTLDGQWNPKRAKRIRLMQIPGSPFALSRDTTTQLHQQAKKELTFLKERYGVALTDIDPATLPAPEATWQTQTIEGLAARINEISLEAEHQRAKVLWYQSKEAEQAGKQDEALSLIRQAISLHPLDWQILDRAVRLEVDAGSTDHAQTYIAFYEKHNPEDARTKDLHQLFGKHL